jgi:hypothetical protein
MGKKRNEYRIVVGEPEGKRLLRRPRWMWEDNIDIVGEIIGFYEKYSSKEATRKA